MVAFEQLIITCASFVYQRLWNQSNPTSWYYNDTVWEIIIGSGKTFTLVGPDADGSLYDVTSKHIPAVTGVLPRSVVKLFELLYNKKRENKNYEASLYLSIVQVYNEQIFDLLQDPDMENPLAIRENRQEGIFIEGVSEYSVSSADDSINLFRAAQDNRAVRSTHMNIFSSRSHTLFQFTLEQRTGKCFKYFCIISTSDL